MGRREKVGRGGGGCGGRNSIRVRAKVSTKLRSESEVSTKLRSDSEVSTKVRSTSEASTKLAKRARRALSCATRARGWGEGEWEGGLVVTTKIEMFDQTCSNQAETQKIKSEQVGSRAE